MFELALEKGTNDPDIRTAVYSQLGNAYFYLKQYTIAKGTDFYLLLIRPRASLIVASRLLFVQTQTVAKKTTVVFHP